MEPTVYDFLETMIPKWNEISTETELSEEEYKNVEKSFYNNIVRTALMEKAQPIAVGIGYLFVFLFFLNNAWRLLQACFYIDHNYLYTNIFVLFLQVVLPMLLWLFSTKYSFWNFHRRKLSFLTVCILNIVVLLMHQFAYAWMALIVPRITRMPQTRDVTKVMIFHLAQAVVSIPVVLVLFVIVYMIASSLRTPDTYNKIIHFKLNKYIDFNPDKRFSYDLNIVKDLVDAKNITIREKDRFLHCLGNGTTGTGKTSTLFTKAIFGDFRRRFKNLIYQKKTVLKYLKEGKVVLKERMEDKDFDLDYFAETKGNEGILEKLKYKAKLSGEFVVAPNAAFSDSIYKLAQAQRVGKINRMDPTLTADGTTKKDFIGFNPLFINPDVQGVQRQIAISQASVLVADVMQAVFDSSGKTDPYFASLNKNMTTSVCIILLLTHAALHKKNKEKYPGCYPTLEDLQLILNDFKRVKDYRDKLIELYGTEYRSNGELDMREGYARVRTYQAILDYVDSEMLSPMKSVEMYNQATGLRIILNTMLTNPLIKNILCVQDSVDFDKMLEKGETTIVNFALELGTDGKAFGQFVMLSYINAVLRRPGTEDTRIPNYAFVDELPEILHPKMATCFSLFRQFRVGMFVNIQTITQMKKSADTAFMENVLLTTCAHHFLFGRLSPYEMDIYEKMAGSKEKVSVMYGKSYTSLSTENPNISFNERESTTRDKKMYGIEMRERDFQELTLITVRDGSPIDMCAAKADFLPKYHFIKIPVRKYKWEKYWPDTESEKIYAKKEKENVPMNIEGEDIFGEEKEDSNIPAFMKEHTIMQKKETLEKNIFGQEPEQNNEEDGGIPL